MNSNFKNIAKLLFNTKYYISRALVTSSNEGYACWNCNHMNLSLFCPKCNSLQKPTPVKNYFELLGIEEKFDLDEINLSKKFKELQKNLHPDKFSNRVAAEQLISEEYSSLVNKAYTTLLQPLARGMYMLSLKGIHLNEKTQLDAEFLQEIMEKNERVENAKTPEEILSIDAENKRTLDALIKKLNSFLKNNDLSSAQSILIHMKYHESINNQIKDVIRRMKIVR